MQPVRTVDKCVDILELLFHAGDGGMGVREIGRRLGVNPTTVHNICWTLCARGYLQQVPATKGFQLGPGLIALAQSSQVWNSLAATADPWVRRCRQELDETILLAAMDLTRISTLLYYPSEQALRVHETGLLGDHAYGTAVGKVLLASLGDQSLSHYMEQFPPVAFTAESLVDPGEIRRELAIVKQQGYAHARDEMIEGVSAVAIPILSPKGDAVASLGASAPTIRLDSTQVEKSIATLHHFGTKIAQAWFEGKDP